MLNQHMFIKCVICLLESLLYLNHNSQQMVFLAVTNFLTANIFDRCRSYSDALVKRKLSLTECKLSTEDPGI